MMCLIFGCFFWDRKHAMINPLPIIKPPANVVADCWLYFLGVCARVINPLPVKKLPGNVRRHATARVNQTVLIDFPSSDLEIGRILMEGGSF